MRNIIIPAILAKSFPEFKKRIKFLEPFFSLIQIDVLDSSLVPNRSFYNYTLIGKLKTPVNYELHLMVSKPLSIIKVWITSKKLKRVIIHMEAFDNKDADLYDIISLLKRNKVKVGLAVNPKTKLARVKSFATKIDFLLIMGVHPGWSGQKILPSTFNKIKSATKLYPKLPIAVDGGITMENYQRILKAGASILNVASLVYSLSNPN
ncbi:MAG: hypothetical protein WC810_23735, partial [Janthinobacterium sp.]